MLIINTPTIKTYNSLLNNVTPGNGYIYRQGAIGEKKSIEFTGQLTYTGDEATGTDDLAGKEFYFNPGLFVAGGNNTSFPFNQYYFVSIPVGALTGEVFELTLSGSNKDVNKNWRAYLEITGTGLFKLVFEFFLTFDVDSFLKSQSLQNHDRLLKNHINNTTEIDNSTLSVYNSQKLMAFWFGFNYDSVSSGKAIKQFDSFIWSKPAELKFYSKEPLDGALTGTSFTNPYFDLKYPSGTPANGLSTYENIQVIHRITYTGTPTAVVAWLIRTDKYENNKDFIQNYEGSFAQITTDAASGNIIDNKLITPAESLNSLGSNIYETTFFVDKSKLAFGAKYRLIFIYYDSANSVVNSFITMEVSADLYPPVSVPGITSSMTDYLRSHADYIKATPQDRIKSSVEWDSADWESDINGMFPDVKSMLEYFSKLEVTLYVAQGSTLSPIQHVLESAVIDSIDLVNGTANIITEGNNLNVNVSFSEGATDTLSCELDFRIRHEADIKNRRSQRLVSASGVQFWRVLDGQITQDWTNKTVWIEYKLSLYYDNAPQPYYDVLTFKQKIDVSQFENDSLTLIESIRFVDPVTNNYITALAGLEEVIAEVKLVNSNADTYRLMALIDEEKFSVDNLQEEESFSGLLPQLTSLVLSDVDSGFVGNLATFKINLKDLDSNKNYRVSAIAKKAL